LHFYIIKRTESNVIQIRIGMQSIYRSIEIKSRYASIDVLEETG